MRDEQIIKAFEYCCQPRCSEECPLFDEIYCRQKLNDETLDLLKRQHEELNRLREGVKE